MRVRLKFGLVQCKALESYPCELFFERCAQGAARRFLILLEGFGVRGTWLGWLFLQRDVRNRAFLGPCLFQLGLENGNLLLQVNGCIAATREGCCDSKCKQREGVAGKIFHGFTLMPVEPTKLEPWQTLLQCVSGHSGVIAAGPG